MLIFLSFLFPFCSGVGWSELKERARTLPSAGQSCSWGTTFDLLQSGGPGEWVVLPQRAESPRFGARGPQDLTSAKSKWEEKKKKIAQRLSKRRF